MNLKRVRKLVRRICLTLFILDFNFVVISFIPQLFIFLPTHLRPESGECNADYSLLPKDQEEKSGRAPFFDHPPKPDARKQTSAFTHVPLGALIFQ